MAETTPVRPEELLKQDFATLAELVAAWALAQPDHTALIEGERRLTYAELNAQMDRVAAGLQGDGVRPGDAIAICAAASIQYAETFLGILRAGAVVAPLSPSSTPESLAAMLVDCGARLLFLDAPVAEALAPVGDRIGAPRIALDGAAQIELDAASGTSATPFEAWLAPVGSTPDPVTVEPDQPFNIIYSSGTTGTPKGIVQPHRMRWAHLRRGAYAADSVTIVSTPLYSNTTLVSFLPTLGNGGTVVLMPKFDAGGFLALSQRHRATHAMLVPVQYRRLMQRSDFGDYDLSSYRMKYATSAPFAAELKADVLARWPGGLTEVYGMTEGGGTCMLAAHDHPDKLHTVGRAAPGHDIRLIDEAGREVAPGQVGEVVGRSPAMMVGYHNQAAKTREAAWVSPEGLRFIRTGDVGRFDAEGFLILMDRKKDMIISGGFNIYPSDLEAELLRHPAVQEAAVVGVASAQWGETPVAFVVLRPGHAADADADADALKAWVDARVGKTQRLADLRLIDVLPRSAIGKVLKRELRGAYAPVAV